MNLNEIKDSPTPIVLKHNKNELDRYHKTENSEHQISRENEEFSSVQSLEEISSVSQNKDTTLLANVSRIDGSGDCYDTEWKDRINRLDSMVDCIEEALPVLSPNNTMSQSMDDVYIRMYKYKDEAKYYRNKYSRKSVINCWLNNWVSIKLSF